MAIQQHSYRQQIFQILDDVDRDHPTQAEIAAMVGCCERTAATYAKQWKESRCQREPERCLRCGLQGWDHNPIFNGICLWCWAHEAQIDLGTLVSEIGWKGVIAMVETDEHQCTYCSRPAFTPGFIAPPMCQRHYEIVLLVSRLQRQGRPITVETIRALLARFPASLEITADQITQEDLSALKGDAHNGHSLPDSL